jgi:hypothetical protein
MNDEDLNLDLDSIENNVDQNLKVKNRFQQLSEKVKLTSQEKDELAKAKETLEGQNASLSKEVEFYKDFSANVTKYPNASEYQAQILEKVKSGYSTEDAMVAVLAKEGKLDMSSTQVQQPIVDIVGGSAPTSFQGSKSIDSMTTDEKFAALQEADKSGDLVRALRGRN